MELILDYIFTVQFAIFAAIVIFAKLGLKFVPQNRAYVIERFGKYNRTIEAGINFIIPIMDKVAHDRSLKEQAVDVPSQSAITKDNISLTVDVVLYFRVLDPSKASFGF